MLHSFLSCRIHFAALMLLCMVSRASADAIAEALDSPLVWSGTGTYSIVTSSKSAAIGGDAVFVENGTLSTTLPGPCDFQMRYRSQGGAWVINTGSTRLSWPVLPRDRWQTISFRLRNAVPGQVFKITTTRSLVDRTLFVSRSGTESNVPMADAVDMPPPLPAFQMNSVTGAWPGTRGLGFDGEDVAFFPDTTVFNGWSSLILPIAPSPAPGSSLSGSWWWYTSDPNVQLLLNAAGETHHSLTVNHEWKRVSMHFDQTPPSLEWRKEVLNAWSAGPVHMLDQIHLTPGPAGSFAAALETTGLFPGGWTAFGDAAASVTGNQDNLVFHDGDAVAISFSPEANAELGAARQKCVLSTATGTARRVGFRVRSSATGNPALTIKLDALTQLSITPGPDWTFHRVYLTDTARPLQGLQIIAEVSEEGLIWLDDFTVDSVADTNELLETSGYAWTAGGLPWSPHSDSVRSDFTVHSTGGYRDGLSPLVMPAGSVAELETVLPVGPSQLVLFMQQPSAAVFECEIDGVRQESAGVQYGSWRQWPLAGGPHTLKLRLRNPWPYSISGAEACGALYSLAVVETAALPSAAAKLAALFGGLPFRTGGTVPVVPHLLLWEGSVDPLWPGVVLPGTEAGGNSRVEVDVPGPAAGKLQCHFASPGAGLISVNGRPAALSTRAYDERTMLQDDLTLHLPEGPHTVRWESRSQPSVLARVRTLPAPVPGTLFWNPGNKPPLVWVDRLTAAAAWSPDTLYFYGNPPPAPDPKDPYVTRPLIPSRVINTLATGEYAAGSFMVTGPCLVAFDVTAWADFDRFKVRIDDGPALAPVDWTEVSPWYEYQWRRVGRIIPAGEHTVQLLNDDEDPGSHHLWITDLTVRQIGSYAAWCHTHGLTEFQTDFNADPEGDGLTNLLEYAFGLDPAVVDPAPIPHTTLPDGSVQFVLPSLPYHAEDITYRCEHSTDLRNWKAFATLAPHAPGAPGPAALLPPLPDARVFTRVSVVVE